MSGWGEQGVDLILAAVDDLQDALRSPGLHEQLREPIGRHRILLRGLQHESVAASYGEGKHPERDHGGEVEWRDAGAHAQGLGVAVGVDAAGHVLHRLAHHQAGDAAGVLHHFNAPPDIALGVRKGLAGFAAEYFGDVVLVLLEQILVAEHQAGPLRGGSLPPNIEGVLGAGDGLIDLLLAGEGQFRQYFLGGRVPHRQGFVAFAVNEFAVDEQGQSLRHWFCPPNYCGVPCAGP